MGFGHRAEDPPPAPAAIAPHSRDSGCGRLSVASVQTPPEQPAASTSARRCLPPSPLEDLGAVSLRGVHRFGGGARWSLAAMVTRPARESLRPSEILGASAAQAPIIRSRTLVPILVSCCRSNRPGAVALSFHSLDPRRHAASKRAVNPKVQSFPSAWASVAVSVKARKRWRRRSRTVQTWTKATSTGTPPRRVVPTIRPTATTCSPPAMNSSGTK
jgi:hypothetical protein